MATGRSLGMPKYFCLPLQKSLAANFVRYGYVPGLWLLFLHLACISVRKRALINRTRRLIQADLHHHLSAEWNDKEKTA